MEPVRYRGNRFYAEVSPEGKVSIGEDGKTGSVEIVDDDLAVRLRQISRDNHPAFAKGKIDSALGYALEREPQLRPGTLSRPDEKPGKSDEARPRL